MTQFGFVINQKECIGCRACQVACSDRNNLPVGTTLRTVGTYETGTYPEASIYHFAATCNHCQNPACVANCPTGACQKDEGDGTVFRDKEVCIGCGMCVNSCPYEHPQLLEEEKKSIKCDGCKSFRDAGQNPICVDACVMRAIEYGDIEELRAKYADAVADLPILPDSSQTGPSVAILPFQAALQEHFEPFIV